MAWTQNQVSLTLQLMSSLPQHASPPSEEGAEAQRDRDWRI